MSTKATLANAIRQLHDLVYADDGDRIVQIERTGVPSEIEVTVYWNDAGYRTHTHYGGASIPEALNRAHEAQIRAPRRARAVPQSGTAGEETKR